MIAQNILEQALACALSKGGDFAEIFAENTVSNRVRLLDGKVESALSNRLYGAGLRVFSGTHCVFACTNILTREGLMETARQLADAIAGLGARTGDVPQNITLTERIFPDIHPVLMVPDTVDVKRKIDIVRAAYAGAKEYHQEISQVDAGILDVDHQILIANSDGLYTQDRQIRTRLMCQAIASRNGETQTGFAGPGARVGIELFDRIDPRGQGKKAAAQAITMLHADYCKAGKMTVAIENGFGGVIFHEACGHSLESNRVSKETSQFVGKLGQKIANEKVTAIDDGTIPNAWGSINIDDEGHPSQKNILIEKGVLKSYMVDKLGGRRMGLPSTGSGRRESYCYAPVSRMTNTYIDNGSDKNEDIIASIDNGLYCKQMGGGSVNPATGEFNFAVTEGYMVRGGKICEPVRGASLIGKGSDVLMDIDMVGQNLESGQGMCGAESGSIPTNVGQPLIRVSSITVGGR